MKKVLSTLILLMGALGAFAQCAASFTYTASPNGNDLLHYTFTNTSTWANGLGYIPQYSLNFGDGNSQNSFYGPAYHNYTATGTYTVTLTQNIYDSLNQVTVCTSTANQVINVAYSPCATSLAYTVTGQSNTSEDVAFAATNPAGTPGMTYTWAYGDGGTGTGANPTHSYTTNGNFTISMTATGGGCSYTNTLNLTVNCIFDCNANTTSVTHSENYLSVIYYATHTAPTYGQICHYSWTLGDGATSTDENFNHIYAAAGTYTVNLTTNWVDSLTGTLLCTKSNTAVITVNAVPNRISGYINFTNPNDQPADPTSKVWLITYDPNTNLLTAVDSTTSFINIGHPYYEFLNEPAGTYKIKAMLINGNAPGTDGYLPTYDSLFLYWDNASNVTHINGGANDYSNIGMQYGTVPSGPGFIGGNVLGGANKNTYDGAPVNGMMIYLRNNSNNIVTFTYTDANGNYSFSNIANGTYSIYPEAINYATTPAANITVNGQVNNIGFYQHNSSMTITPYTAGVNAVTTTGNLNIYPNPSNGNITLQWNQQKAQTANIIVTDAIGRQVYTNNVNLSAGKGLKNIDLNNLSNGLYIISIKSAENSLSQKLSIQK